MRDFIMDWLDPIGIIIGLLLAIPIVWTWLGVTFGKRWKHRKWFNDIKAGKTVDAVLIVDLLIKDNMVPKVWRYLKQNSIELPEEKIFKLIAEQKTTPEKLPRLVEQLRNTLAEISRIAPGKLHVFYGGPAAFAMLMGAEMANKGNITVYQHTEGEYINWGPIRHASF